MSGGDLAGDVGGDMMTLLVTIDLGVKTVVLGIRVLPMTPLCSGTRNLEELGPGLEVGSALTGTRFFFFGCNASTS